MTSPPSPSGQSEPSPQDLEALTFLEYQSRLRDKRRSQWGESREAPAWSGNALLNIPEPQWLLPPVLQERTLAAIVGGFGTYKSFFAVDMAMSLATGRVWEFMSKSHMDRAPQNVVFVEAEGFDTVVTRAQSWLKHRGLDPFDLPDTLHVPKDVPNLWADHERVDGTVERVMKLAVKHDARLIVIDTLHASSAGGDTNAPHDMNQMVHSMRRMRDEADLTVLVVHHYNKSGEVGGSNVLPAACDTIVEIQPVHKDRPFGDEQHMDIVGIETTKQRRAPRKFLGRARPVAVRFREARAWTPEDMVSYDGASLVLERTDAAEQAILSRLGDSAGSDVAVKLLMAAATTHASRSQLVAAAEVQKKKGLAVVRDLLERGELFEWSDGRICAEPEPSEEL